LGESQGGVLVMWFSNAQAIKGDIPEELLAMLPSPTALRQGRVDVGDQFQYAWGVTEEKDHVLVYATFRRSFAIAALSAVDRSVFLAKHAGRVPVVLPGGLRSGGL